MTGLNEYVENYCGHIRKGWRWQINDLRGLGAGIFQTK